MNQIIYSLFVFSGIWLSKNFKTRTVKSKWMGEEEEADVIEKKLRTQIVPALPTHPRQ